MKWRLRQAAARRGVLQPEALVKLIAAAGLEVDSLTVSELWSGRPDVVHLGDIEAICIALDCAVEEIIVLDLGTRVVGLNRSARSSSSSVRPIRRSGRSVPP